MKMMKSVLAVVVAVCLMMCLAVSAYATEPTETIVGTTETATDLIATAPDAAVEETTGAAEETTAATGEETVGIEEGTEDPTDAAIDMDDLLDAAGGETGAAEEVVEDGHDHTHTHEEEAAEETGTKPLKVVLIVLQVIASLALILVVLAQSGKESGLSGALSGNSDSYMNKSGAAGLDKKLAKATKWVALAWVLLTLILFLV